jgi:hypothetical protein
MTEDQQVHGQARRNKMFIGGAILFGITAVVLAYVMAWSTMGATHSDGFWVELGRAGMQTLVVGLGTMVAGALKQLELQQGGSGAARLPAAAVLLVDVLVAA